jgi:uncharacterized protein YbcI
MGFPTRSARWTAAYTFRGGPGAHIADGWTIHRCSSLRFESLRPPARVARAPGLPSRPPCAFQVRAFGGCRARHGHFRCAFAQISGARHDRANAQHPCLGALGPIVITNLAMSGARKRLAVPEGLSSGEMLSAISDGLVALHKDYYGEGPSRVKTYYQDDLVVCLLRGGFTRVEQTLQAGGHAQAVFEQRMAFQAVMRQRLAAVVEHATNRRVIDFISGNQPQPDMICEVFILAPGDVGAGAERPQRLLHTAR